MTLRIEFAQTVSSGKTKRYIEKEFNHTAMLDLQAFEKFVFELNNEYDDEVR